MLVPEKPIVDPIEKSLKLREKDGNIQNVVKSAKSEEDTTVFKLKLKGSIPELQQKKVDPTMVG